MPARRLPLRPGDVFRIHRGFPRRRIDEDRVDFLRVHFETDAPGLGHVVEVRDDGAVFQLWGHLFHTPIMTTSDDLRPLNRLQHLLAPERLGEAILRREAAAGRVVMEPRPRLRQPLVWLWLRHARDRLPILEALGGRIHLPPLRWTKAHLHYWLGRLGVMPPHSGFLDHGLLVDRIGATVEMGYGGRHRTVWLDRILLHKNHSIHLVGIDLDSHEQRTFRLDRVWSISIPALGDVERDDLYWELQALRTSRRSWLWYWNRHQERQGRPPAPPIGMFARTMSLLAKPFVAVWNSPQAAKRVIQKLSHVRDTLWLRYYRLRSEILWHVREFRAARRPLSSRSIRSQALTGDAAWRRRLERAIATEVAPEIRTRC